MSTVEGKVEIYSEKEVVEAARKIRNAAKALGFNVALYTLAADYLAKNSAKAASIIGVQIDFEKRTVKNP